MKFSVREIAQIINADIIGDPDKIITGVSSFEDAVETDLTFASDIKYLKKVNEIAAGAVIIPETYQLPVPDNCRFSVLTCKNPKLEFFKILDMFHPPKKQRPYISEKAVIGENVMLGPDVTIHPNVFIGDNVSIDDNVTIFPNVYIGDQVKIGSGTVLKPNITVMEKSVIGKHVLIHSGTVIGSDGFGFVQNNGHHEKLVHTGFVQIDDHVEIGACNTIDRGTFGRTLIESGVKTDNLVHIAHNVKIGKNSLIVAQAGIAGSTRLGHNVILAGRAGVSGHLTIGNHVIVGPNAGVVSDVPDNQIVSGFPHMPHKKWLKISTLIPRLVEFRNKIQTIEKKIFNIEKKISDSED